MSDSHDPVTEWSILTGRYITGFAYLERLVYEVYDQLPRDSVSDHGRTLGKYSDRARFLQALLRSSEHPKRAELEQKLEQSFDLAVTRNQLAHNPMLIDILVHDQTKEMKLVPKLRKSKDLRPMDHITLEGLARQLVELDSLTNSISGLLYRKGHNDAV